MFINTFIILGFCCIAAWMWGVYCGVKMDICPAWKASLIVGLIYLLGAILIGILIPFPEVAEDEETTIENKAPISAEKTMQKDTVYVILMEE